MLRLWPILIERKLTKTIARPGRTRRLELPTCTSSATEQLHWLRRASQALDKIRRDFPERAAAWSHMSQAPI